MIPKEKKIQYRHYLNYLLTKEPYFMFHNFEDLVAQIAQENNFSKPHFEIQKLDLWDLLSKEGESDWTDLDGLHNFTLVSEDFNLFKRHEKEAQKFLLKTFTKALDEDEYRITNLKGTRALKILETQKWLNDAKVKLIFKPYFTYQNFEAASFAYDKEHHMLYNLKFNANTNIQDYIKAFFDLDIITKSLQASFPFLKVNNYALLILDYPEAIKKGTIPYCQNFYAATTKNAKPKNKKLTFQESLLIKRGRFLNYQDFQKKRSNYSIFEYFRANLKGYELGNSKPFKKIERIYLPTQIPFSEFNYEAINPLVKQSIKAYFENQQKDQYFYHFFNAMQKNQYGIHPFRQAINDFFLSTLNQANKRVYRLKNLNPKTENYYLELIETKESKNQITNEERFLETITHFLYAHTYYVWYDFETISLPEAILDFYYPYDKLPFQVSLVWTFNGQEKKRYNHVLDTQALSLKALKKIIDLIYRHLGDQYPYQYVSYNKSFENSVISKIAEALALAKDPEALKYQAIVMEIKSKTLDLEDFFKQTRLDQAPIYEIGALKGKSSIKLLEKFLSQNHYPLKTKIVPYQKLAINNGLVAMQQGILRYLNITTKTIWEQKIVPQLKAYCQNDVVMMLMIFEFLLLQAQALWKDFDQYLFALKSEQKLLHLMKPFAQEKTIKKH